MIFFSIGLPSRFADWCDGVLARLIQRSLGPVDAVPGESLEDVARNAIRTGAPHLLVMSRRPEGRLRQALFELNARSILAMNHPYDAVRYLAAEQGHPLAEATRITARSCASMAAWTHNPTTCLLYVDNASADPIGAVRMIAGHFGLPADERVVAEVAAEMAEAGLTLGGGEDEWFAALEEHQRAVVEGAVGGYVDYFGGRDIRTIVWQRDLFYLNEQPLADPHPPATRPLDISGTARRIIFGPYITLPAGSWSVSVGLAFSKEAAEIPYSVQVISDVILSQVTIQPEPDRIIHANLQFSVNDGAEQVLEVCVQMERASIGGRMALVDVVLSPIHSEHADAKDYLDVAAQE